jgi:hypothetical protein
MTGGKKGLTSERFPENRHAIDRVPRQVSGDSDDDSVWVLDAERFQLS